MGLAKQNVSKSLVYLLMALLSKTRSWVRVSGVESDRFEIGVGVHQGSVLVEAARECRVGGLRVLLFAERL